jgi:hypothetical protein
LIPMANSLSFGLMLATGLILILVPTTYRIYYTCCTWFSSSADRRDDEPPTDSLTSFANQSQQEIQQTLSNSPAHVSFRPVD